MSAPFSVIPGTTTNGVMLKERAMYLDASDHACPHLRKTHPAEPRPAPVQPALSAGCPFSAARAAAEPPRLAVTAANGGGWWAFKAEALAMAARL